MARSTDISQRIILTGADEVRAHLEEIAAQGQRTGNTIRAQLQAATGSTTQFASATTRAAATSGQMRYALQNLSFQVNDVATSLASGGDVMRVFAQQSGQVLQAFQQGGGFGNVMTAAAAAIGRFITPTTAAVAGIAAVGVEVAALVSRAADAESAAKQFDVMLKAVGQTGRTTGKDLEAAAENMHDVGVSADEARQQFRKFIAEGGLADQAPKIVRTGAELNKVLGEGSLERFVAAAAQGGAPLEAIAKQLGIVVPLTSEASKAFDEAAKSTLKFNQSIVDAIVNRNRQIADVQRSQALQIEDLTRKRGTAEEEILLASKRRIEDIERQHNLAISDMLAQRFKDNQAALAAYNKQIEDAAQAAGDKQSLIVQIGQKVLGSFQGSLTPLQAAVVAFSEEWNKLQDTLAKSETIRGLVSDIGEFVRSISDAIKWLDKLGEAIANIPGLPVILGGRGAVGGDFGGGGMAAGGLVQGPGTGTSDSVPIWASHGEYVVNALATRMNLPLLQAINSLGRPAMPRIRGPRFAVGGMVGAAAAGGGTPVHFHLDGQSFALVGERKVVDAMTRAARRSGLLSAGRKPSTA